MHAVQDVKVVVGLRHWQPFAANVQVPRVSDVAHDVFQGAFAVPYMHVLVVGHHPSVGCARHESHDVNEAVGYRLAQPSWRYVQGPSAAVASHESGAMGPEILPGKQSPDDGHHPFRVRCVHAMHSAVRF